MKKFNLLFVVSLLSLAPLSASAMFTRMRSAFKPFAAATVRQLASPRLAKLAIGAGTLYGASNMRRVHALGQRPAVIQEEVDKSFAMVREQSRWGIYNGLGGFYDLTYEGIAKKWDNFLVWRAIAQVPQEKDDIYLMDIGCAQGGWGKYTYETLRNNQSIKESGKRIHIFNITGGKECEESVTQDGNVTLYQLNQVKIENIDEEILKRGYKLEGNVDLIVSHWTMRHVVDPMGTLSKIYRHLTVGTGTMASTGFGCSLEKNGEESGKRIQFFPRDMCGTFRSGTNMSCLFRQHSPGHSDPGNFFLIRTQEGELDIPLEYTGNKGSGYGYDGSTVLAQYKMQDLGLGTSELELMSDYHFYCNKNDVQCANFYQDILLSSRAYNQAKGTYKIQNNNRPNATA